LDLSAKLRRPNGSAATVAAAAPHAGEYRRKTSTYYEFEESNQQGARQLGLSQLGSMMGWSLKQFV
jgi:hypothetical protein